MVSTVSTDRQVTLIGVDGSVRVLACAEEPWALGPSPGLWGTAPYDVDGRQVGEIPGEQVRGVRALARSFVFPIRVSADTELGVDQALADLGPVLDPRYDTRVIYERADGSRRELSARYSKAGDAVPIEDFGLRTVLVPLIMRASWPFWRSVDSPGTSISDGFNDGYAAGVNQVDVTNNGDVPVWATFKIDGYAEAIEAANLTTGGLWRIRRVVAAGQQLVYATDPRWYAVTLDGYPDHPALDPISVPWPLVPGVNRLLVRGNSDGAGSGVGTFTIEWDEVWQTC